MADNATAVRLLISEGHADPNIRADNGLTPLLYAVRAPQGHEALKVYYREMTCVIALLVSFFSFLSVCLYISVVIAALSAGFIATRS